MTTFNEVTSYVSPALASKKFNCPHCNAFAQQSWVPLCQGFTDEQGLEEWVRYTEPYGSRQGVQWWAVQCGACDRSSIWLGDRMVYPARSALPPAHEDMPSQVATLYNEAREVAAVSRRAGAAMARATLELLLHEVLEEAKPNTGLMDLIDLAYVKVSSGLGDLLTFIRIVGNSAVHVDESPDAGTVLVLDKSTTEAMDAIFAAINETVDELITKPKQTAKFAALIPADKMADVLKKRAKREEQAGA